jgi:predicted nucleic acid-binding protein
MIHFIDTSALAKLFIRQAGSQNIESFVRGTHPADLAVASIMQIEVRSGLQRRFRNRELDSNDLQFAANAIEAISLSWVTVPMDPRTIQSSLKAVEHHALRSLDAIQLGTARLLQDEAPPGERLLFIASDHRLLAATTAEGLPTWNPESGPAPVNF